MTPNDVLNYFKSQYNFNKVTGMSHSLLAYWIKRGKIPEGAQYKLERITEGALKTDWSKKDE
jgi:hypothetical protein